jgi:Transglycosylase-like domain/Putative peptidoglycan binding domain
VRRKAVAACLSLAALAACALVAASGTAIADDGRSASTGGGASAMQSREVILRRGDRGPAVKRVQRRLRLEADGVFGRRTESAVKRFQRRKGLEPDGIVGPLTRRALRLRPFSRRSVHRRRRVRLPRVLRLIAECESGGNPRAVSSDGRYRGKFQFTRSTWRRLGGRGDPARAPAWRQDRLALKLYRRSGTEPWGACGRAAERG